MRVLRRPSGPENPKVESAVGITLTRGLRANGEIKSKRGMVHLAHWNAHGREWADLLAQQNDQSSYDERILTEVRILFPIFRPCTTNFALMSSPRTASCAKEKDPPFLSGPFHKLFLTVCPTCSLGVARANDDLVSAAASQSSALVRGIVEFYVVVAGAVLVTGRTASYHINRAVRLQIHVDCRMVLVLLVPQLQHI